MVLVAVVAAVVRGVSVVVRGCEWWWCRCVVLVVVMLLDVAKEEYLQSPCGKPSQHAAVTGPPTYPVAVSMSSQAKPRLHLIDVILQYYGADVTYRHQVCCE